MDAEAGEVARKLIADARWMWPLGIDVYCVSEDSRTPLRGTLLDVFDGIVWADTEWAVDVTTLVPDIESPATMGHLMAMLWKVNHKAHTYCNAGHWFVTFTDVEASSPGKAVALALLSAWENEAGGAT